MYIVEQIKELLLNSGACDVGFAKVSDGPAGLQYAVSIVLSLSDAVMDEITDAPTYTYFHHYRTVNAYMDRLLLQAGLMLQNNGYHYIPIAASQSTPVGGERTHMGRYSHKKAAVLAGLGNIGKSTLFLHRIYGPRVRLGTLFTDCLLPVSEHTVQSMQSICGECKICVRSCPAGAIKDVEWREGIQRSDMFDADACNGYMRDHFMKIGRGSVCGICVKVCPHAKIEKV
jgi:epoxyqueuosine reductase QueG